MHSRRMVLGAGLGGVALVAAGGVWRVSRTPETALAPWDLAPEPPADVRLDALRHAILAPNPHNRQPWLMELVGTNEALVSCELARRLPVTDPFDRQITIGFGAFLELARMAAAERGVALEITPFPDGQAAMALDHRPVANLRFTSAPATPRDPLFRQIVQRRSNKEEYDLSRAIAADDLATLAAEGAGVTADPGRISALRTAILAAIEAELTTPAPYRESVDLMRIGHAEVDANPDGIELYGPMIEAGRLVGMIDRTQLADPDSNAFKQGLALMRATYGSIAALLWVTTPANTRLDQLEAGRRYVRANLQATALGIGMHPVSQSLQEYAEVQPMYARVHKLLGTREGERVQMLARLGYGPPVSPTPRWPLETRLV